MVIPRIFNLDMHGHAEIFNRSLNLKAPDEVPPHRRNHGQDAQSHWLAPAVGKNMSIIPAK